ncbi:hypothetical protein [Streptomyces sp. NPDC049916]|uniref:hypothetical protein n=1 Tax=Streptomyces sp. NPDC049916 TaxID=3155156 RepID=UPI0034156369
MSFSGATGTCQDVHAHGDDAVRAAPIGVRPGVELWSDTDGTDGTGGAITIGGDGYSSVGAWVSACRDTRP